MAEMADELDMELMFDADGVDGGRAPATPQSVSAGEDGEGSSDGEGGGADGASGEEENVSGGVPTRRADSPPSEGAEASGGWGMSPASRARAHSMPVSVPWPAYFDAGGRVGEGTPDDDAPDVADAGEAEQTTPLAPLRNAGTANASALTAGFEGGATDAAAAWSAVAFGATAAADAGAGAVPTPMPTRTRAISAVFGDKFVPPHELAAQSLGKHANESGWLHGGKLYTFSQCEGRGRTLTGRDIEKVRTAVMRQTGFLDR